jgi:hypothetical protein
MKPLNIDKTGCSNTSSNCVVWQGPTIECINLCKGDSITEVTYKLAMELCTLMDTFDISQYDLKCFAGGACNPTNFKEFVQLLINKICYVQSCAGCDKNCDPCNTTVDPTPPVVVGTGTEVIVPINPAFYYTNGLGDTVTVLPVSAYAVLIGNTVATVLSQITVINGTLSSQNTRITALELAPAPVFVIPEITPVCVLPSVLTPMNVVLASLEQQYCQLVIATGSPNNILTGIGNQPAGLNAASTLSNPLATMATLPGWTSVVQNQSDSIGNLWVAIADMRLALVNIINNYLPSDCSGIGLTMYATYSPTNVTIHVDGTIPVSFVNTFPAGTLFTISDTFGASTQFNIDIPSILNSVGGFVFDISTTPLNAASNLTVAASPSFTSTTTGSQCQSVLNYVVQNTANCPVVTYTTPSSTDIDFTFTSAAIVDAYKIECYDALTNVLLFSNTYVGGAVTTYSDTFTGLTALTTYKVRAIVSINLVNTPCDFTLVTTP